MVFRSIKPYNDGLIGIHKNKILFKPEIKMVTVFSNFKGSRHESFSVVRTSKIYFGEYFQIKKRKIKIFVHKHFRMVRYL